MFHFRIFSVANSRGLLKASVLLSQSILISVSKENEKLVFANHNDTIADVTIDDKEIGTLL